MGNSQQIQSKQKTCIKRLEYISGKWLVPVICIMMMLIVVVFANYHRPISANSLAVPEFEPVQQNQSGQVQAQIQEIEKMARTADKVANKPSIWPVRGEVTSGFGWRNSPWGDGNELHAGIDIANSMNTPIVATADGEVVECGVSGGYGNIVKINHGNGIETIYGHNSRIAVSVGQSVKKGEVIAYLGNTGRSTGPHAHYEVRVNGTAIDPTSFLVLY